MIELSHVTYQYPGSTAPVVDDLSLTIGAGDFVLVCGPSGTGKSTFLRLLNGLVPHFYGGRFGGCVSVWGRDTLEHQPRDLADLVGFVFQDPEAQFVVDIVEDEIVFAMENLGLPQRLMRRRVEEVLDQLGIADLRRRRIATLSGGEKQRVAIAAVLAAQPRALVLDEPTSQLDPHGAEEVLTALQKLNADIGTTIVLSEHRLERVLQYTDKVLAFAVEEFRSQEPGVSGPDASGEHRTQNSEHRTQNSEVGRSGAGGAVRSQESEVGRSGAGDAVIFGPTREVLPQLPQLPPLQALGRALNWQPLPLTLKEARPFAGSLAYQCIQPSSLAKKNEKIVNVEGVTLRYNQTEALYQLGLSVRRGELLALMGRNGSGKSSLLRLLIGLLRPQEGRISLFGRDIAGVSTEVLVADVGYVPQDPRSILFHDTLREELAFTLGRGFRIQDSGFRIRESEVRSQKPEARSINAVGRNGEQRIAATLDYLQIGHLAERYPRALSGGEAQRAALAAILVADRQLLLLDEPTRGLDYAAKAQLGALLRSLCAEGRTVIMATHDVELVAAIADRVALLGDGELVAEGTVVEVLGESMLFSSQIAKLFPGSGWLTVEDILKNCTA